VSSTSAALPAAARSLAAMRLQPPAHAVDRCVDAANMRAALQDSNKKTFELLLEGGAVGLRDLRVLLLSDSTDYNALAYAGDTWRNSCASLPCSCTHRARGSHSLLPPADGDVCLRLATNSCTCERRRILCLRAA
jgi:hypothetical protein